MDAGDGQRRGRRGRRGARLLEEPILGLLQPSQRKSTASNSRRRPLRSPPPLRFPQEPLQPRKEQQQIHGGAGVEAGAAVGQGLRGDAVRGKHSCAYHNTLMERNKQYVVQPPTVDKCQELSKQLYYTRIARLVHLRTFIGFPEERVLGLQHQEDSVHRGERIRRRRCR